MKKYFLLLFTASLLIGCNDDEPSNTDDDSEMMEEMMEEESENDNDDDDPDETDATFRYYSLAMEDHWEYEIESESMESTSDTLTVSENTVIEGEDFSTFNSSAVRAGFMTNLLASGALRETETQLLYTGTITIPFEENEIELSLPITPLFDQTAVIGDELSSFTETIVQEIEQAGMTIPLTITATITTVQAGLEENATIGPFTFERLISGSLNIRASITAEVLGIPIILLQEQNVLAVNNSYAQDVGLVESTVSFNYEFEDLSPFGIELPFPQTGSQESTQTVISYEVSADD